jgi:hypothetical protein
MRMEGGPHPEEVIDPQVETLLEQGREMHERAQQGFDLHVANLEGFEAAVANDNDVQDSTQYLELHNELLRRIYEAGLILDDAIRGEGEDKEALDRLAA